MTKVWKSAIRLLRSAHQNAMFDVEIEIRDLKEKNKKLQGKLDDAVTRNSKLELDARSIAAEGLLLRAHEITRNTSVLIISTPNISLVNHGTYANLMSRLQNICGKFLDATIMVYGELKVEQLSPAEAANKYNIVAMPSEQKWSKDREKELEKIASLIDRKYGL
jgi:hypothetical protein